MGTTQSVLQEQAVLKGGVKVVLIVSGERATASSEIRVVAGWVSCARQIHCAAEVLVSILTWVGLQTQVERCLRSGELRLKLGVWMLQQKQWGLVSCYSREVGVQVQVQGLAHAQVQFLSLRLLSCRLLLLLLLLLEVRVQVLLQVQVQVLTKVEGWPRPWRGWATGCPTDRVGHSSYCPQQHLHSSASEQYACLHSCVAPSSMHSHPGPRGRHEPPTRRRREMDCSRQAAS